MNRLLAVATLVLATPALAAALPIGYEDLNTSETQFVEAGLFTAPSVEIAPFASAGPEAIMTAIPDYSTSDLSLTESPSASVPDVLVPSALPELPALIEGPPAASPAPGPDVMPLPPGEGGGGSTGGSGDNGSNGSGGSAGAGGGNGSSGGSSGAGSGGSGSGGAGSIVQVPTSPTLLLIASGLIGLAAIRRHRQMR